MFPCRNTNGSLGLCFSFHVELLIEISAVEQTVHDPIRCFHFETTNNKAINSCTETHRAHYNHTGYILHYNYRTVTD